MNDKKACSVIEHPSINGWGCCECRGFNGHQRLECKFCGHLRCNIPPVIVIEDIADFPPVEIDKGKLN